MADPSRELQFAAIRSDWYVTNTSMPRELLGALDGSRPCEFVGFPRQWLPFFAWLGVRWRQSIPPPRYIPFYSDTDEAQLVTIIERCRGEGVLRALLEAATLHDSVLADCLYIVDHRRIPNENAVADDIADILRGLARGQKTLTLNGWQSYGRPSLRALELASLAARQKASEALLLPCALKRPYDRSHTHRKIQRFLSERGIALENADKIVMTSVGILPEAVWNHAQVLGYVAGVPDVYRLLRLARSFFLQHRYEVVYDCLQFEPYSDVLRIVQKEGLIDQVRNVRVPGRRPFYVRPPNSCSAATESKTDRRTEADQSCKSS